MQRLSIKLCVTALLCLLGTGCATSSKSNTARTASEQVLLSSAIDRSLSNISFRQTANRSVFVDDKYLDSVDKGYLIGTIRHKVLAAGGSLVADAASADLVLEVRSGGVGTDMEQSFVGIPSIGVPGLPIELPEIKLISRETQKGTAKIGIVAYSPKSGEAFGLGGESTALANNDNMYFLGIGPFKSGAVKEEMDNAVGSTTAENSFARAIGVEQPRRRKARPVALVDATRFPVTPEQPQVAQDVNVASLPALPVSHQKSK